MSSVPKNEKSKKLVEAENKKPPKKNIKEDLDLKRNNKTKEKEKEKVTKNTNKKTTEKVITNEPIEKEMLKDAMAFENVSNMPARVKCATLSWHTLDDLLNQLK